jgi:hypothetical protein
VRRIGVGIVWLLTVAGVVTLLMNSELNSETALLLPALTFVGVGTLISIRTRNRIGWINSFIGLALIGAGIAEIGINSGNLVMHAAGGTLWFSWFVLAGYLMLWYPTGKASSPRWRFVQWIGYYGVLVTLSQMFAAELCLGSDDSGGCISSVPNPIGISWIPNPEFGSTGSINLAVLGAFLILSIASIFTRFFKSRGTERLQLKWFAAAAASLVAYQFLSDLATLPIWLDDLLFAATVSALPLSIGVAILRYRLFEIDRIISRTLGYALVVAILAVFYVVVAIWIPSQVIGEQPPVFVAAATLAAAAAFNPLRRSILRFVDRRFYRSRYDTEIVMSNFADNVRDQVDMDRLTNDWIGVVVRTMGPRTAGIWMRKP